MKVSDNNSIFEEWKKSSIFVDVNVSEINY